MRDGGKKHPGFGFVEMATATEMHAAIAAMNEQARGRQASHRSTEACAMRWGCDVDLARFLNPRARRLQTRL